MTSARDNSDLERQVIAARRRLVEVRARRDEAKSTLQRIRSEADMARAVEDSLFRQLVECESDINNLFRELVDTPSAIIVGDGGTLENTSSSSSSPTVSIDDTALVQLISMRSREEENTLRRLQDDLEAAEREYSKVSKLSQVQRAEMLRLVKSVAKEYRTLEQTAAREDSELFRLKQESQDVIARTASNKIRIVKELFQL